jgi:hypothetical protein
MWQMEHSGCRLCSMTFLCGRWTTVVAVCVPGRPYVADGPQWLPYVFQDAPMWQMDLSGCHMCPHC